MQIYLNIHQILFQLSCILPLANLKYCFFQEWNFPKLLVHWSLKVHKSLCSSTLHHFLTLHPSTYMSGFCYVLYTNKFQILLFLSENVADWAVYLSLLILLYHMRLLYTWKNSDFIHFHLETDSIQCWHI